VSGRVFIGVDNGVTGTLGAVPEDGGWSLFSRMPTYKSKEYMRSKTRFMTHLDPVALEKFFRDLATEGPLTIVTERPLVNPKLFKATMSAVRCHEILLATMRRMGLSLYATWDSRDWQSKVLGKLEKGETKPASLAKGLELYPDHAEMMKRHGDADGILMAHWLRECVLAKEASQTET